MNLGKHWHWFTGVYDVEVAESRKDAPLPKKTPESHDAALIAVVDRLYDETRRRR